MAAADAVFYPAFALALSVAVQTLELYLVFAVLIGPACGPAEAWAWCVRRPLGVAACMAGMGLSWPLDWPSGTGVALGLCVLGVLSVWGAPGGWG